MMRNPFLTSTTLTSLNVNGLNRKLNQLLELCELHHWHILALQETHTDAALSARCQERLQQRGFESLFTSYSSSSAGVGLVWRAGIARLVSSAVDVNGRWVFASLEFASAKLLNILVIYTLKKQRATGVVERPAGPL